ncbi:alpha subunit of ribonucleoside-diphosphate reductase [Lentinula aciculospora]|uniref:Ribonucleoside-diphosphate reductase n=1 Tax=Lentinula aciculospora TaxID=153920 RepID=A0A9W9DJT2_9AGAR|nr:alpha subunit of ribonucleoside-diphosphate reductase [Lentinula aciculospora]
MITSIIKRDGRKEQIDSAKLTVRVRNLCYNLDPLVNPHEVTEKAIAGVYPGITTAELDNLTADTAAYLTTRHPDYATLASRISVSKLHKETKERFSDVIQDLHSYVQPNTGGKHLPRISDKTFQVVMAHREVLDNAINHELDFDYQYFGFKILERAFLLRLDGKLVERIQHLIMRIAVCIHENDIASVLEAYNLMSQKYYMHASAALYDAGTTHPQICNCFLTSMRDDSVEGVLDALTKCCQISRYNSGVSVSISNHRAKGSLIPEMPNGVSPGLVPMLRTFNAASRYVDQGAGKRLGAFNMILEPWHADIFEFLDLKKNNGKEEMRARDLFLTLWVPDLFMKRVKANEDWSLFCPSEAPGLDMVHSKEFEELYARYEREGRARSTIPSEKLWKAILATQIETGGPFMLYKDSANVKSNQQNLGTIRSTNLCVEILEYTSSDEVAVCTCASLALPAFVNDGKYDFKKLHEVTKVVIKNLDRAIDVNFYPVPEARTSNLRHRPLGLGVQGLADAFMKLHLPFDSDQARVLNQQIFETIYHGALEASVELAERYGPYETWIGSPAQQGKLQYDLWGVTPSSLWNWSELKERIASKGIRNSLLVAPMPTSTISSIFGYNECFEPYTSNMYTRRLRTGEFQVVCPWLIKDLVRLGLWNDYLKNQLIANGGSIQDIAEIPADIKAIYKTVWEISQRHIIDMSADRGAFICQSQSLNIFMAKPTAKQLTAMHFHGWKKGLKSGLYYLRTRPAVEAIQFTVDKGMLSNGKGVSIDLVDLNAESQQNDG